MNFFKDTSRSSNMDTFFDLAKKSALEYMSKHPTCWEIVKSLPRNESFSRTERPEVLKLMNDIDQYSGFMHSGASIAIVMRYLQSLT